MPKRARKTDGRFLEKQGGSFEHAGIEHIVAMTETDRARMFRNSAEAFEEIGKPDADLDRVIDLLSDASSTADESYSPHGRAQLTLTLAFPTIVALELLNVRWGLNKGRVVDRLVREEMRRQKSRTEKPGASRET